MILDIFFKSINFKILNLKIDTHSLFCFCFCSVFSWGRDSYQPTDIVRRLFVKTLPFLCDLKIEGLSDGVFGEGEQRKQDG